MAGGVTNIVEPANRDWQSLVRKIERGATLEDALSESGIPEEELGTLLSDRLKKQAMDEAMLHVTAAFALKVGVQTLCQIALAGPRLSVTTVNGETVETVKPISTDLDAAKALVNFGLRARNLASKASGGPGKGQVAGGDLFDRLRQDPGPWDLKDPKEAS